MTLTYVNCSLPSHNMEVDAEFASFYIPKINSVLRSQKKNISTC